MLDKILGALLIFIGVAVIVREWLGSEIGAMAAACGLVVFLAVATPFTSWSRKAFVAIGLILAGLTVALLDDWPEVFAQAAAQGAFIATFFIALASLRTPASASPAIERCGQYLASQPPGKRYMALTIGGHLFALILNYGAITLLGGLTEAIAGREKNAEIREIRNRRMLLAVQRGLCASLCWSPLAFATAITTSVVAGSSWGGTAPYAILFALVFLVTGWALDTLYKPTLSAPPPARQTPIGSIRDLAPLLTLLVLLFAGVGILEYLTGLRIIAVVMLFVPVISIGWIAAESGSAAETLRRLQRLSLVEFPSYRSELVLLVMAGIIGTLGAALIQPLTVGHALDLSGVPVWLVLVAPVWIIPLLGQLGMNPILSVSMLAPLLPAPASLGLPPNLFVAAVTAGWALAGATSPFTATTLLVGRLGHVSALTVGLVWNRAFTVWVGAAVSLILVGFAGLS
ncbi:hypothetical protein [Aurantimonas sp. 22II-16-19i]|uniref:hypothetical protein n=1 Tax=Aurantimonas sp. 22II-16-19i TaxID=1317114 RepID=UPI0009F7AF4A|nr:hypothetical protein [Aurantimonas sp. 22II-16-19i]ORE89912.1 hypothetical protein ATO4_22845 [Aurantimonas sp. 22II-16-19i]